MIRVAIVDDDPAERTSLRTHLEEYRDSRGTEMQVLEYASGEEFVAGYRTVVDIAFLDVMMGGIDGFETARRVRELDTELTLIFTTRVAQMATRGYEVEAFSYLVKPVRPTILGVELDRVMQRLARRSRHSLLLPAVSGAVRVDVRDVIYLESIKHRVIVYTRDQVLSFTGSLKAFEQLLTEHGFVRSNSCYLINLRHVTGVQGTASVMRDGSELQVSRARRKAFLEALTDHVGNHW